jgi:hypothetical protein
MNRSVCGVSSASVAGNFTCNFEGKIYSDINNNNGVAVITIESQTRKPSYTFSVNDVSFGSFSYDQIQSV